MEDRLRRVPGVVLVSIAAALWGTDALFRRPLAHSTSAATIVFGEHVFLVLLTLPFLASTIVALRRGGVRYLAAAVAIGAGASALATILFTQAFVLPASAIALLILGAPATAGAHDTLWIIVLAFVTGAVALALYYIGLKRTPAMIATLGELAFPATAVTVGYVAFGASLRWTQWL